MIADILKAMSKAPVVVGKSIAEMPVYMGSEDEKPLFTDDLRV